MWAGRVSIGDQAWAALNPPEGNARESASRQQASDGAHVAGLLVPVHSPHQEVCREHEELVAGIILLELVEVVQRLLNLGLVVRRTHCLGGL